MAVYFDYKIHCISTTVTHTHVSWHKNFPLLAVASVHADGLKGVVSFYLDEGEAVESSLLERGTTVSCLSWHPTRKFIAVGWKSGEINLWNEHDHEVHEGPKVHQASLTGVMWNGTGSRLITADESGNLCVWKVDLRGRMQQTPMFKHDVASPVVQMVFKLTIGADVAANIAAAATAAVSGDQNALDMFSWQRSGTPKFSLSQAESIQLFFGAKDGNIYFLDERGKCGNKFRVEGAVKFLLYYESREIVVTVTESLLLSQHLVKPDGECTELVKVKLSGQPAHSSLIWAGSGIVACASQEHMIRLLDIENDQNYALTLDSGSSFASGECINCIAYNQQKGILAGGTSHGKVAMWKYNPSNKGSSGKANPWELLLPSEIGQEPILQVKWGAGHGLLAVRCKSDVTILNESVMNSHFNQKVAAVQVSPSQLSVEMFPSGLILDLKTDVHIKGVFVTKSNVTIWNNKKVIVYEVAESKSLVRAVGSFTSDASKVAVYEQSVCLIEPEKVTLRTFQGTVKQELTFSDQDGDPTTLDICGSFMVVGSNKSIVKVFDVARREVRQVGVKNIVEVMPSVGAFHLVKCNCNGSKVAFVCETANGLISSCLHVWDVESDTIQSFDFAVGKGKDDLDETLASMQEQMTIHIKGCIPKSLYWDASEPKLLVCEASRLATKSKTNSIQSQLNSLKGSDDTADELVTIVVALYSSTDHGLIVHDHFKMSSSYSMMLGVDIPFYYLAKATMENENESNSSTAVAGASARVPDQTSISAASHSEAKLPAPKARNLVAPRTMRDFVGLENAEGPVKEAMVNFSYLSSVGNMDEAFKAIKTIKRPRYDDIDLKELGLLQCNIRRLSLDESGSVWENMARMCVKTKRLDVAMVCLGNMSNASAAKAVRESATEPELDARVAMLALQLGMHSEAEQLYMECGRFDLLNQFYQAANNWSKAIEVAERQDRIHLRTTYYNYGKYLESIGNVSGAIQQYERSDTYRFEVPRLLFDDQSQLESYVNKSKDRSLRKWWGQYLESCGDMDSAVHFYDTAQDYLAQVRVYCFCGKVDKAADICNDTGNKAACYHLARHYDGKGDSRNAIHYFSRAQAYTDAIRLAKENDMHHELMNLALLSSQEDMLDAARYFEERPGQEDKAVMLYHKGGNASKAIDLAFRSKQFGALQLISEDLDENTNPDVLNTCADFFIEHGQFERAVGLLVIAKKFREALQMCMDHNVTITEELAEKISLPKDHPDQGLRTQLLEKVAECAFKQGSYHLATKKFTQAGNKIKAMKALLKSGDTEKIVFFAGVSRQREIYVMAANYLQSLAWREDPEIMKNIIAFYTKGRAFDSLASFYDSCAQVEIDEFQNYEKAFGALTEGYKSLTKAKMKNTSEQEERLASIKSRLTVIKKFIQAKRSYDEKPEECVKQCQLLLDDPDSEAALRIGDVYAVLIEHYARTQDFGQAYSIMESLRKRQPSSNLVYYVSPDIIDRVHKAVGVPYRAVAVPPRNGIVNGGLRADIEDGEIVEDVVPDEADEEVDDEYI